MELPAWKIILYKSGTCINGLLLDPIIHITMWIYIGIRFYARLADEAAQGFEFLEKSNIGVLGGFLSFFLGEYKDICWLSKGNNIPNIQSITS